MKKGKAITSKKQVTTSVVNVRRRNFIKYALFGGLGFVVGRYLQPILNTLKGDVVLSERTFDDFDISETGKQLRITDNQGDELLVIDKDAL